MNADARRAHIAREHERRATPTWRGPLDALAVELPAGAAQAMGRWWAVQLSTGLLVAARVCGAPPSFDRGLEIRLAAQLPAPQGRVSLARRAQWESEARMVAGRLGCLGWRLAGEADRRGHNRVTVALVWTEAPARPAGGRG